MIRTVLIDDEAAARLSMRHLLGSCCPRIEVIGEADSVESGIQLLETSQPDLVFLDVKLQPGSGFDILQAVAPLSFEVIFVTAHNEFAIRAIRFSALDYLLKPVDAEELIHAVERLEQPSDAAPVDSQLEIFKDALNAQFGRIILPTLEGFVVVELKEVVRCEADRNYTHFHMESGKKLTISRTLKYYEQLLSESGFVRVHQSHLVNLGQIREYKRRKKGGLLFLQEGSEIPVSDSRKEDLMSRWLG
ncbi:MAG: LytTR family DNA-binding domain-containing protein [Bacteroidota bacterium]